MRKTTTKKAIEEEPVAVLQKKNIHTGDIMTITPTMHGNKGDLVWSDNGFVYILKKVTPGEEFVPMKVRVTAQKEKYGFVEFMERVVESIEGDKKV